MITASSYSKTFDGGRTYALDKVNIEIKPGDFVAIIGLSGAGKTTFLRAINGTNSPGTGSLKVLGRETTNLTKKSLKELRKKIGFIFQQFNLVKNISAIQNVLCGRVASAPLWRVLTGCYSDTDRLLAKEALDSVGLRGRYHERASNLSGGQQQRVAIARALVQKPEIILADEPMASLDPKLSTVVLDILKKINKEQKITVLVNIHVLKLAQQYASRIIAFRKGSIVFDDTPDKLSQKDINMIYQVSKKEMDQL